MRDHWIFGDSMHLQFTDLGIIELPPMPFFSLENSTSVSDTSGNLLFYGNNEKVYNRNGLVMEGGDSLSFKLTSGSATHGVLAIPVPCQVDKYIYLYSIYYISALLPTLAYCVIDLSDELGYVQSWTKGTILVENEFAEQVGAVRHGNGRDWWIVSALRRGSNENNEYAIHLLNKDGIQFMHEQEIGDNSFVAGEMTFSSSGDKIARGSIYGNGIQIYEFDRCSGFLSNPINLGIDKGYGCAFSTSGKYLYYVNHNTEKLFQVEVATLNTIEIFSGYSDSGISAGQMEMGPDGKIYFTIYKIDLTGSDFYSRHLGVINYPDSLGLSCGFDPLGIGPLSRNNLIGLPNHPNYYLGPLVGSPCDTLSDPDTTTAIQPILVAPAQPCFELITTSGSGSITLSIDPSFLNSTIELYNSSGAQVYAGQVNTTNSMLNTTNRTPGVYVARLRTPNGNCPAQKFVVAP